MGWRLRSRLALAEAVLTAVASLDAQAAVGPELAFGAKTMRTLDEDDEQGGAHGTDVGNLTEQTQSRMLTAVPQKLGSNLLAQS